MSGWVGGWVGELCYFTSFDFFFLLKYVNKQDMLIPNIVSKFVIGIFIKSYDHFKFDVCQIEDQCYSGNLM